MNATLRVNVLISGDVQISVTYGQEPSHQCLHDNDDVTLTCTVNPLTNTVDWYHDTTYLVSCIIHTIGLGHIPLCFRPDGTTDPRYTPSISDRESTLRINPISPGTDAGVYTCKHGGDSDSITIDACGKFQSCFTHNSLFQVMFRSV